MAGAAVSLNHMRKEYRSPIKRKSKVAVEDISFEVAPGEIFGLLGPNGAGKTTTLKMMLGLVVPTGGEGTILGKPLGDREAHRGIGFLPEEPYFYGFMTAEKSLDLYGRLLGMDGESRAEAAARLIELVGLPADSHLTLDKYSKGMVQRFGVAQALLNDPELLILDEPSSGLDPVGQKEIRDILMSLRERGKTIFLSSHQLSEVENICDSVCIVNRGNSVREGPLGELLHVEGATRVVLRGVNETAAIELHRFADAVADVDGATAFITGGERTYDLLERARVMGAELVSVEPHHRSLEDLFMEAVREAGD